MKNEQNQKELVTSRGGSGSEKERKTPLLEEYGIKFTGSSTWS